MNPMILLTAMMWLAGAAVFLAGGAFALLKVTSRVRTIAGRLP